MLLHCLMRSEGHDQRQVTVGLRFPPALWERLTRTVGQRKRAAFIHEAVEKALDEFDATAADATLSQPNDEGQLGK